MNRESTDLRGVAVFRADAVYSRAALAEMLRGIVTPELFLERLAVPLRFKNAVLGADILEAMGRPHESPSKDRRAARGDGSWPIALDSARPAENAPPRGLIGPRERRGGPRRIKLDEVS